jgi:hypothetical protein
MLSLFFYLKRKEIVPTGLSVYLPINVVESSDDTIVSIVSSDDDVSETSFIIYFTYYCFMCNNIMKADAPFEYFLEYFKHSLSINNKPMNVEKTLT